MSFENPAQIMRSWNLQGSFANGRTEHDRLIPKKWKRIRTPFVQTWREETINTNLDWGSQAFSFYIPESLQVISSMYLKVPLPALQSPHTYKKIPGIYAIKTIRFLSAGQEAYSVEVGQYLRDYIESLDDERAKVFCETYLGLDEDTNEPSIEARDIMVPILLPNSAYMARGGHTLGKGVWPCFTGKNRIEVQITMNAAANMVNQSQAVPASISGNCTMMIHQVDMTSDDLLAYSDARKSYSIITRRFTEITNGYTAGTANQLIRLTQNQPIGVVTELFCIAQPSGTSEALREIEQNVLPQHFAIVSDSQTQKSLNTRDKVRVESWSNGFVGNSLCNCPGRLCFAAHASETDHFYSGGYNMQLSSQITVEIEFPENVDFRVFAVQLQRVTLDEQGLLKASLD